MINFFGNRQDILESELNTKLYDQNTFYRAFIKDLKRTRNEVIIESPFVTVKRLAMFLPIFKKLTEVNVSVIIHTKDPSELDDYMRDELYKALSSLLSIKVQVVFIKGLHRKLVVIDREILYEGSLNILSQNNSIEMMRRIESINMCWGLISSINEKR
jgi:phosphatidylserine/phosphatidylglycerophosphate/cardiolipin synthase-like enzyme